MKILKRILFVLLILVIGAAIYLWIRFSIYNQETKTITDDVRKTASGQFVKLSEGFTHYQIGGADTGQVVILVHGFSVPYYIWDATYDRLIQNGFRVVRYDEYGRGFSDRPELVYNETVYRNQLLELINALKLKTPVTVAGLSFGGAVVSDFAVHHPDLVNKIILVDPVYPFGKIDAPDFVANYKMAIDHEKQASGQLEDFKYPERFPDWVDKYKVQMQYKGFRHALISTRNNFSKDTIISNYKQLGQLQKDVLLIWGKEDKTVPFQFSDSVRKYVPVDFYPVNDAGHLPHLEKSELVIQKIIAFIRVS